MLTVFETLVVTTQGKQRKLKADLADEASQEKSRATSKEECPKCKHPELEYHTMQLRSADEGQTVFYNCKNCGHTFNTNT